jgi:two-component system cell cycle sensor histidine kinase PleC
VKFTPGGGAVTLTASTGDADVLEIAVTDTGIGMNESEINIALSPFGQIDSSLARQHQGTGLGLPLCKSLLELHGAELIVTSKPGEGTKIVVRFPAARVIGHSIAA